MGRKKAAITAVILCLASAGILYYILGSSSLDTSDVQEIYFETIDKDKKIERIPVAEKEDVEYLKTAFSCDTYRDSGFVFAESGFRIVLTGPDKEIRLYPYCGDLEMIRIGDKGRKYCGFAENSSEYKQVECILKKYIDLERRQGIFDWDID